MLWIALYLPRLSLEAFAATLGTAERALPVALLQGTQLSAVNRIGLGLGLKPGQKKATALALVPHLLLAQACSERDAQAQRAVAHAALVFTPAVTLQGGQTVLLEVSTTLRAFGGFAALLQRLEAALVPLALSCRMASAPSARGAALLAQWGLQGLTHAVRHGVQSAVPVATNPVIGPHSTNLAALRRLLDGAPLGLLAAGQAHAPALQAMGLQTLADLRALPRDGLARRFGEALLTELDRARGDAPDPRVWVTLPETFESRLELFARADSTAQVLHGAAVLLQRLVLWARAQQARVLRFTLALQHEPRHRYRDADADGEGGAVPDCSRLDITLAEASNDPDHLQLLLRERLARMVLPAPTLELRLHCSALVHRGAPNSELFPTQASQGEGLLRLVERLQARLGPEQVLGLRCVADHRPERATEMQPIQARDWAMAVLTTAPAGAVTGTPARMPATESADEPALLTRPSWLLCPAQPLKDRDALPLLDGRALQILAGPERIESGWWDGDPIARDYFVALAHDGSLVWIYRARLLVAQPDSGWFLHGRFG